jgi:hypothetical protein
MQIIKEVDLVTRTLRALVLVRRLRLHRHDQPRQQQARALEMQQGVWQADEGAVLQTGVPERAAAHVLHLMARPLDLEMSRATRLEAL